jgi:tetratricopeptide (TPR) repeat protein
MKIPLALLLVVACSAAVLAADPPLTDPAQSEGTTSGNTEGENKTSAEAPPVKVQRLRGAVGLYLSLKQQFPKYGAGQLTSLVNEKMNLTPDEQKVIFSAIRALPPTKTAGPTVPPQTADRGPINPTDPTKDPANNKDPLAKPGLRQDLANGLDELGKVTRPNDPAVYAGSGEDQFRQKNYPNSYRDYEHARELGDRSPQTTLGLGEAANEMGDYETAARAAQEVLDQDPTNAGAQWLYHASKGRVSKVNLPNSFGELGQSRSAGNMDNVASAGANQAVSPSAAAGFPAGPTSPGMTAAQAAAAANQAKVGQDAAVRSGQFTKDAANALHVKDYTTAYQLASQAISLNPANAQALNYRAISLSRMQRYSDAVQDASVALTLAPGSAAVLQTRSWAFAKQGKYKESLVDAEATLEHDPKNAFAYQNLAFARAGLGDREGALDALRHSAEIDPRFKTQFERAVQLPQDSDLTLLFDDGATSPAAMVSAPAPIPGERNRKFVRLAIMSATGGLLIALGLLHIVSASWREKMRMTVRRVLGPSAVSAGAEVVSADAPGAGAFWTQYELVKEIGLGGMGVVYEATDRSLERRVAVKKMRDEIRLEPQDRQRFVAEARIVAQLHHPNIVDIYGIVEDGMDVYLVFEFVDGRTLQDALKSGGPMDLSRAAKVVREIASAVTHAHEKNIIHRDLKPSNVMLTSEGRIKVMDFGIARMAKDSMTRHSMTNTIAGTPPYMAPEQEQGTVRRESDVYALGVCLYEMTTGHLPFTGTGAAMLLNKLNGKLIPPSQRTPSVPPGLDAVIAKALAPDPDKRYRTPAELVAALESLTSVDLAS